MTLKRQTPLKKIPKIVAREVNRQGEKGKQIRLMFQDEGRFGRINECRSCWAPRGIRPEVPVQFVREYTYAYAVVSPHDGVMDSLILPEVNAEAMSIFLAEISRRHADEFLLIVMDQAAWHRSKDLVIPDNVKLIWQPPYSPQCNPVENLWDEIREKWFPNLAFKSLEAVEDTLVEALVALETDNSRTKSITGFDLIVNINLNAT
jgi:transposase